MDKLAGRKTLQVGNILDEFEKDKVKAGIDIVVLFQSFGVVLEPKGKSYKGACPWHDDSTPSLSVDREKGLYNCFGCGESGDAFSLVEKMKGLDFKGALDYLKVFSPSSIPVPKPPVSERKPGVALAPSQAPGAAATQRVPPAPAQTARVTVDTEQGQTVPTLTLDDVARHYQSRLTANPKAYGYLEARGLSVAVTRRFSVGFCDGTLQAKADDTPGLEALGILTTSGREFFEGCIVVPLLDDQDRVVSFYGRKIDESHPKHLYLKGKHRGLVNGKAAKVYPDELILTESVLDALSLVTLGFDNVIPCYGTSGFTPDHLEVLKEARTQTVVIAFDADEPGRTAAAKLAEKLVGENVAVKTVEPTGVKDLSVFPEKHLPVKDWNEFLVSGGAHETVRTVIDEADAAGGPDPDAPEVTKDGKRWNFRFTDVIYRVLPAQEVFVSSLRVNIRAEASGELFLDNCDLYSARSRTSFSTALSRLADIESVRIEKDLLAIVQRLEAERDKALEEASPRVVVIEPTETERDEALRFLRNPSLFTEIASDMDAVGYVGEEANKLVTYLAGISRLLEKPLSVYIQAGSSSGKSFLIETVRRLLPVESVLAVSSFSDQALNYMKQDDLEGKVMLLGEAIHNEIVEGQIRQMQSEGELSRLVVVKDPKSGSLESRQVRHRVRLSFMMSSTALYLNPENASRCLVLHTDESKAQTERILELQRHKKTFDGWVNQTHWVPEIVKKHQTAGRLLERLSVFNPLSPFLRFPVSRPTMRRAQDQFLTLLEAVALVRQFQKKRVTKTNPFTGEVLEGIDVDLTDYAHARELFREAVLLPNANELPSGARLLYESIQSMAKKKAGKEGLEPTEVSFIQREVRELSELGLESIKKYLRALVDFEYLELQSGRKNGTRFSYRLRDEEDAGVTETVLPTVEELESLIQKPVAPAPSQAPGAAATRG